MLLSISILDVSPIIVTFSNDGITSGNSIFSNFILFILKFFAVLTGVSFNFKFSINISPFIDFIVFICYNFKKLLRR